jgi:copper resistance protein B
MQKQAILAALAVVLGGASGVSAAGAQDHGTMQGGKAPPDARDPHAYAGGQDFGPIPPPRMMDEERIGSFLADRFEVLHSSDSTFMTYDVYAWYGRDYDRVWIKTDGEADAGRVQDARNELLWGHALTAFWDTQLGVRYDTGAGPERGWLALGVQGIAPYWFNVEATAYVGEEGRTALRVEAEYELLLTQKLVLQPRIETTFYGKRDAERERGSGLASLDAGLRLRYEIRREFAPYAGIEWGGKFRETADFVEAAGEDPKTTRLVAGLRFWF